MLIEELLLLLRDLRLSSEEDSVLWKGGGLDIFRIRVAYNLLAAPQSPRFSEKKHLGGQGPNQSCFLCVGGYLGKNPHVG